MRDGRIIKSIHGLNMIGTKRKLVTCLACAQTLDIELSKRCPFVSSSDIAPLIDILYSVTHIFLCILTKQIIDHSFLIVHGRTK